MSKRQRGKHDLNIAKASPRSAKKMKISSRLKRHKLETRQDSSKATSGYVGTECSLKLPAGHSPLCSTPRTRRHRMNTSHSESETEIIWDGNSPTAHLQRRIGRNGHSKAGDISEIVQCVNNHAGSIDEGPPDMPLLGLWMTRSPGRPAVDLSAVRKHQGGTQQESSKSKTTNSKKKSTSRLSLLQAELEKVACAINRAPSFDDNCDIRQGRHQEETSDKGDKEALPLCTDLQQPSTRKSDQSTACQLKTDQAVFAQNIIVQHATSLSSSEQVTAQSTTKSCPISKANACHLAVPQAKTTQKITEVQASTSQSSTSTLATSGPKSNTGIVGQSIIFQSVTGQSNSAQCGGHSETIQSTLGQYKSDQLATSWSKIGQINSGQFTWSVTGPSNGGQFFTAESGKGGFNTDLNARQASSHLASGHLASGQMATGQMATGQMATGQMASALSKSGQTNSGQFIGQSNTRHPISSQANFGSVISVSKTSNPVSCTGQSHFSFTARSKTGHSFTNQLSNSKLVTSQSTTVPSVAGQLVNTSHPNTKPFLRSLTIGQLATPRSNAGHSGAGQVVTGQSNSGNIASTKSRSGQVVGQSGFKQSVQSQLNSGRLVATQSIPIAGHSKSAKLVTGPTSIGQSGATSFPTQSTTKLAFSHLTTGQLVSARASTNFRPNYGHGTSQPITSQSVTKQPITDQQHAVKPTSGQVTLSKTIGVQSVPDQLQTKTSVFCQANKNLISHQSNNCQAVGINSHTNHQNVKATTSYSSTSNSASVQLSVNDNEILWGDDSYFEDEILLEQLSQTEALEMSRNQFSQMATNSNNRPGLNAVQPISTNVRAKVSPNSTTKQGRQIYLHDKPAAVSTTKASHMQCKTSNVKVTAQTMVKQLPSVKTVLTSSMAADRIMDSKALTSQHAPFTQHLPIHRKPTPALAVNTSVTFSVAGNPNASSITNHGEKLSVDKNKQLTTTTVFAGQVTSNSSALNKPALAIPSKKAASRPADLDASDLFESSLTDEMMMSLCAGMDSPQGGKPTTPAPSLQHPTNPSMPSAAIATKNHGYQNKISSSKAALGQPRPPRSNLHTTTASTIAVVSHQIQGQQQNYRLTSSGKMENIASRSVSVAQGKCTSRPDPIKTLPPPPQACQSLVSNHVPPTTKASTHSSKLIVSASIAPAPMRGCGLGKMAAGSSNQENIGQVRSHPNITVTSGESTTAVTSTVKGSSQRVCSQTEIERKRKEAMARRGNRAFSYS